MARPHIDFIQAQALPWTSGLHGALGMFQIKTLAHDSETGAATFIARVPPGWRGAAACYLPFDQEIYILDGELEAQGQKFGLDCYGYWPAGFQQWGQASPAGADVLVFAEGTPDIVLGKPLPGRFDVSKAVPHRDTHEMPWSNEGIDPDYAWFGMSWKVLRHDPATEATTFLLDTPAQRHPPDWMGRDELHHCREEIMLLAGELCCPYGIMTAGAYLNRPAGIRHGPYYSRFGNTLIGRVDGKLENNFGTTAQKLTLKPPHQPRLPDALKPLADAYRLERY
ncbi:MAG: hypothetical protein KDE14_15170 [Rhodobacteraceae bacterium]|nr:hypothetical protein [Paracoccaceae bacterium]